MLMPALMSCGPIRDVTKANGSARSGLARDPVFARSYCQVLVLKEDDFQRLFKGNPEIKAQIDKESDARFEINRRARDAVTD